MGLLNMLLKKPETLGERGYTNKKLLLRQISMAMDCDGVGGDWKNIIGIQVIPGKRIEILRR